jgi:tetratricopeptide (TPR) repeat protein
VPERRPAADLRAARERREASGGASSLDEAVFFLHLGRAREQVRGGRLEEASRELELARLARPDDWELLSLVSVVKFRLGEFSEAARVTRSLLEKNSDSAVLHANLGLIQFKAGALEEAERELRRATEIDPGHARGHLYLGLLYRQKGDLPAALERLRRAGAGRAALEVEEAIRRAEGGRAPLAAVSRPGSAAFENAARESIPSRPEAEDRPTFAANPDGSLAVASRGLVLVRRGSVRWFSGRVRFTEEPAFAGTRLDRLLRAEGPADLLLCEPGRHPVVREAAGQPLFLEGSRVLALSAGLRFRLEAIHDLRTHRRVDILRVQGRGGAVVSVSGTLEAHDVSPGFPLCVCAGDLVAWTGDILPSVPEDRFLDEAMTPDPASLPRLLFEGSGAVLTEGSGRDSQNSDHGLSD